MRVSPAVLLGIALLVGSAVPAQSSTLAYDFTGFTFNPATVPANATASPLVNDGLFVMTSSSGTPPPSGGEFDNSGPSGTHFTSFTLTPDPGFALNLLAFSFDESNLTNSGPVGFDIYTSVDAFGSSILGGALSPNAASFTSHSVALGSAPYLGLVSPVTIRISGFGGPPVGSLQGAWLLDNITLTVDVVPVPEPATIALVGLGVVGLIRRRRG
jgi:hypothetical protein